MIRYTTAHIDAVLQYHTIKQEDGNKTKKNNLTMKKSSPFNFGLELFLLGCV